MMKIITQDNLKKNEIELISKAIEIRNFAYTPYSNYKVGAALLDSNGRIHTGCNIESADYTLTSHAEMVAVDSMVKSGCLSFSVILIALKGKNDLPAVPCGLCLQKMSEFSADANPEIRIVNLDDNDNILNIWKTSLNELLPYSFNKMFLQNTL